MEWKIDFKLFAQEDKKKVAQQKKDDDDRANNRPVDVPQPVDSSIQNQAKSFWSNLSSTPCFLPAVTDSDVCEEMYSRPPVNNAARSAFMSDGAGSFGNRAFVSKSASAWSHSLTILPSTLLSHINHWKYPETYHSHHAQICDTTYPCSTKTETKTLTIVIM